FMIVGLAVVIFLVIIVYMKPVKEHLNLERLPALQHMFQTFKNKNYQIGFVATMFMSLGGYLMMPWGSAYSVNNIGISQGDLPLMFMVVGLVTFAIMPIAGILSDKFNKFYVFAASSILMVISVIIYTHLSRVSLTTLILVNIMMMMGIMARMIPSQALAASIPEMKDRGAFMSINSSLQQLAGGIAALIGGWIVTQKNEMSPLENFDILGYLVIALILINIYLTYRVHQYVTSKNQA
ncbi:MAG: MFS transporter, partial [Flavobacteriales bacterium]|nr:MFS transporter [Flavobacteriales bacterium]